MTATTLFAVSPSIQLSPPKGLFWHEAAGQWCSKIGYHTSQKTGKEVRSMQYYSHPQTRQGLRDADREFITKKAEWNQIVVQTKRHNENDPKRAIFPDEPKKRPLWPKKGAEKTSDQPAPLQFLAVPNKPGCQNITITEAKTRYLADSRKRVSQTGAKSLKDNSHNSTNDMLEICLQPWSAEKIKAANPNMSATEIAEFIKKVPIGTEKMLSEITRTDLKDFVEYWWSKTIKLSPRTRKNYCLALRNMLTWCEEEESLGFDMPKKSQQLFHFGQCNPIKIAKYDPEKLKLLKKFAAPKTWFYCLSAMNGGMYQGDLSDLRIGEVVKLHKGEIIPLTFEQIGKYDGSYDLYIYRLRNRTEHHHVEQEDSPHRALHWLFPEIGMMLATFLAPANAHLRLLLNDKGEPLMTNKVGQKTKDTIRRAFRRACKRISNQTKQPFKLSFKQFRKIGVTAVGRIGDDTTVRLYRSQPPVGDAKFYQLDDYESKLTPVLKKWRTELIADGVL